MKKLLITLTILSCLVFIKPVQAQVNINVNIGAQPVWGPVGYDYVEYYYMPDIEVYYYVPSHRFIYFSNGKWIFAASLPTRYASYNLYSGYKVVINEPRPYMQFESHKIIYAKYKGNNGRQVIIKNSNDPKYYVVKGHPHNNGGGNNGNGKGNGNGNGKGKGKH